MTPKAVFHRELGHRLSEQGLASTYVKRNLIEKKYAKTEFHTDQNFITDFDFSDPFVTIISATFQLELWDLTSQKKCYQVSLGPSGTFDLRVRIIGARILCYGKVLEDPETPPRNILEWVNFSSGEVLPPMENLDLCGKIYQLKVYKDRLFCPLKGGGVGEWDLQGNWIGLKRPDLPPEKMKDMFFKVSDRWLVIDVDQKIFVFSRFDNSQKIIDLTERYTTDLIVIKSELVGDTLGFICEFLAVELLSRCVLMDLTKLPSENAFQDIVIQSDLIKSGYPPIELCLKLPYVYVGSVHGETIRYNCEGGLWEKVGEDKKAGQTQKIHFAPGFILSQNETTTSLELYISDEKTLKPLGYFVCENAGRVVATASKVLAQQTTSLILWDFLPSSLSSRRSDVFL